MYAKTFILQLQIINVAGLCVHLFVVAAVVVVGLHTKPYLPLFLFVLKFI